MIHKKTQTFNSGVVKLYHTAYVSEPGGMPQEGLSPGFLALRYQEKTVGMERYYKAMREGQQIILKIRCPRADSVSVHDVAVLPGGVQYRVRQVQLPEDVSPPVMDLALERMDSLLEVGDG